MIRRPPRSTLFPTRRSSDLRRATREAADRVACVSRLRPMASIPHLFDGREGDRKSTRLNSSHSQISYAVFCLKKKNDISETLSHGVAYTPAYSAHRHPMCCTET